MLNPDYRDILSALAAAKADFLLVGAYALASHGLVRATSDMDIWVRPTPENADRVVAALVAFGAPREKFSASLFAQPDQVLQIGVAPVRVDILTSISGVEFPEAWERRKLIDLDGITIPVLSLQDLARNKRASGRPQDLVDLQWIQDTEG
jgi:hypothetical protein